MADIWDITRYVESNPDDYKQRWRLAKKLYMNSEYRLALEHLQVLKKDWEPKVNVIRYLGATLHRLGRYEEAAAELQDAVDRWSDELPLWEQLAKVLEAAGRLKEAALTWEDIAERFPEHPRAAKAMKRLWLDSGGHVPQTAVVLGDSDEGPGAQPEVTCPRCGARNGDEIGRCWRCHAMLVEPTPAAEAPVSAFTLRPPELTPVLWLLFGGLAAVMLLSAGVYLSVLALSTATEPGLPLTVQGLLRRDLALRRVMIGLVLVVAWPVILRGVIAALRVERSDASTVVGIFGILLAGATHVASFLPKSALLVTVLVAAIGPLALLLSFFRHDPLRALKAWAVQGLFMGVVGMVSLAAFIGVGALTQFSQIRAYAAGHDAAKEPGKTFVVEHETPFLVDIEWKTTRSNWLDARAGEVAFLISAPAGAELGFEVAFGPAGSEAQPAEMVTSGGSTGTYVVEPGARYTLRVDTLRSGASAVVTALGVLEPVMVAEPRPAE